MVPSTSATVESSAAQKVSTPPCMGHDNYLARCRRRLQNCGNLCEDLVAGELATMDSMVTLELQEDNLEDESTLKPMENTQAILSQLPSLGSDACNNALNTPELLEAIISLLPVRGISANAQRVTRTWHAVAQSPSIRASLWLRPQPEEVASPVYFVATNSSSYSPALHVPSCMPMHSGGVSHNSTWIFTALDYRSDTSQTAPAGFQYHKTSLAIPRPSSNTTRPAWCDMRLTEPSMGIADLHILQPMPGSYKLYSAVWVSVQDNDGLTFGTVLTIAQKARDGFDADLPGR